MTPDIHLLFLFKNIIQQNNNRNDEQKRSKTFGNKCEQYKFAGYRKWDCVDFTLSGPYSEKLFLTLLFTYCVYYFLQKKNKKHQLV